MTLDVDELDILDIQVGQKAEITADAISDRTFEGVGTSISSAGTTSGGTTTYPVTIRIDDTGSLMPGMNATAALDIPPCRRYVIVKATAGFAVFRLILKSLLFYSCLDFTQNLGKTHFCLTFGVHFSIRSLFFGIFFNVFAIGIYSFDSCFLSTAWISYALLLCRNSALPEILIIFRSDSDILSLRHRFRRSTWIQVFSVMCSR